MLNQTPKYIIIIARGTLHMSNAISLKYVIIFYRLFRFHIKNLFLINDFGNEIND